MRRLKAGGGAGFIRKNSFHLQHDGFNDPARHPKMSRRKHSASTLSGLASSRVSNDYIP